MLLASGRDNCGVITDQQVDQQHPHDPHHSGTLDVIINPAAGSGRAGRRWPEYARALANSGYVVHVHETAGPGDATKFARNLAEQGAETIVCVGGDGTVNEVVNGMIVDDKAVSPNLRLAILSCGTGQDLVRSLGVRDIESSLQAISLNVTARIDLARVQFLDGHTGHLQTRYFINVADAGIGASVAQRVGMSSKKLGGLVSYLRAALQTIIRYKPWQVTVDVDGEQVFDGSVGMVVFANGRYFAGGMLVAPSASLCDGLIDVYVLEGVGKRVLLTSLLPRVYRGKHVGQPGIQHYTGRTATVRPLSGMLMEIDGEQVGRAPLSVTMIPRALRVVGSATMLDAMAGCAEIRP
jgi:diacylglycerol kinase (ATP)